MKFVEGTGKQAFIDGHYVGSYNRTADGEGYEVHPARPGHEIAHYPGTYDHASGEYRPFRLVHEQQAQQLLEQVYQQSRELGPEELALDDVQSIARRIDTQDKMTDLISRCDRRAELFEELSSQTDVPQDRIWRHLQLREMANDQAEDVHQLANLVAEGDSGLEDMDAHLTQEALENYQKALDTAGSIEEPAPYFRAIDDGLSETLDPDEALEVGYDPRVELAEEASIETAMAGWSSARQAGQFGDRSFSGDLDRSATGYMDDHEEFSKACVSQDRAHDLGKPIRDAVAEHTAMGQDGTLSEESRVRQRLAAAAAEGHDIGQGVEYVNGLQVANQLDADYGTPNTQRPTLLAAQQSQFSEQNISRFGHPSFAEPKGLMTVADVESLNLLLKAEEAATAAATDPVLFTQLQRQQEASTTTTTTVQTQAETV